MTEEKIPRKKLIKLCRKLQERVRIVEAKHSSVVKKYNSVKADADSAKAKILELQAQLEGMEDEINTQAKLMEAQKRAHKKEIMQRRAVERSIGQNVSSKSSQGVLEELKRARKEVEDLKREVITAKSSPSPHQVAEIETLTNMVEDYKKKAMTAIQYGNSVSQNGSVAGEEETRLRREVAKLLEENEKLRKDGGMAARQKQITNQLMNECASLRRQLAQSQKNQGAPRGRAIVQQKEELEREKEVWMKQLVKTREVAQTLEKQLKDSESKVQELEKKIQAATKTQEESMNQMREYSNKVASLETQIQDKERLNAELMEAHAEAKLSHERTIQENDARNAERYGRLLKELTQLRENSKRIQKDLEKRADTAESERKRLHDLVTKGRPGERRIFELAEMQARREHKIREVSGKVVEYQKLVDQHEEVVNKFKNEIEALKDKMEEGKLSKKRSGVNLDYLKAIMIKFIQLKDDTPAQSAMYPVIAKVLCFSKKEQELVRDVMKDTGIYGYMSSFIWSQEAGGLMKDAPPVVEMPKEEVIPFVPNGTLKDVNAAIEIKEEPASEVGEV